MLTKFLILGLMISYVLSPDLMPVNADDSITSEMNVPVTSDRKMATVKLRRLHSFQSQVTNPNTVYVIKNAYDLNGAEVIMPDNCVLSFKKGSLSNGTLIGANTMIRGARKRIFNDVSFKGTFDNAEVYSEWFPLKEGKGDNRKCFDAIMALANGPQNTSVYIEEGTFYTSVGGHGGGIAVPSDTHVHNRATIVAIPTHLEKFEVISICNVRNVVFEGGQIIGDVDHHLNDKGEWGYGIGLLGARDCTVKDIHIQKCWGDGINIQSLYSDYTNSTVSGHCYNIRIDGVTCDDNRRQGLSIEGAMDVEVINSIFTNTGKTKSTLPSAGIDIEPWFDTQIVRNIKIENCRFENNIGGNLIMPLTDGQWKNKECYDIVVRNNVFDDCNIRFNRARNVVFEGNVVGMGNASLEFNQYYGISVRNNVIDGAVTFYTEGDSENAIVSGNTIKGGKCNAFNVERVVNNNIDGSVYIQEVKECLFSNNKMKYEGQDTYSFICDNAEIEISGNEFELDKPLIFRYETNAVIYENTFVVTRDISPACIIMQTARGSAEYDAHIEDNTFKGIRQPWVNYSARGRYDVKNNKVE